MSWLPTDISGGLIWLRCDWPQYLWQGDIGGSVNAKEDNDQVRRLELSLPDTLQFESPSDATRPFFRIDGTRKGTIQFGNISSNVRSLAIGSSTNLLTNFYTSGSGFIAFWVKRTAVGSTNQVILDTRNGSLGSRGITVYFNTSNQIRFMVSDGTSNILDIAGANSLINDTNWHYVEIECATGTNNCRIIVDGGTPVTGTLGTLTSGAAGFNVRLGARSSAQDQALAAELDNLFVGSTIPGSSDRTALQNFNPDLQPIPFAVSHQLGIGGVTATTARWKMRWTPIGDMDLEWSRNADLSDSTIGATGTNSTDSDGTGGGEMTGLSPGTRYYYSPLDSEGERIFSAPYPYFRTARAGNSIKVAISSCQTTPTESAVFAAIAAENPDVFLHVGDRGYPDSNTLSNQRNNYRAQHADDYYRNDLVLKVGTECIYDDHDGGPNNWHGSTAGKENALQVLKEYTPMHDLASPSNGAWRKWKLGNDLVEFFMIDVRYQRQQQTALTRFPASSTNTADTGSSGSTLVLRSADSPSGTNNAYTGHYVFVEGVIRKITNYVGATRTATLDAAVTGLSNSSTYFIRGATYLGAEQLAWLIDGVNNSTARWKAIISPTNFNPTYNGSANDRWGEYDIDHQSERNYIIQQITASDVVVLSGDAHFSAIDDGTTCDYPELTASHLNRSDITAGGTWSNGSNDVGTKYGIAEFSLNACRLFVRDRTGANVSGITPLTVEHSDPVPAAAGRAEGGLHLGLRIGI